MKTLFIIATLVFSVSVSLAQETRYQTFKAGLKISANKDGENYQWENKNITTFLDYRNGDFITRLKNSDFHPSGQETGEQVESEDTEELEYILKGIFPITEIINQKNITQTYPVELQLICDELRMDETVAFEMTITRPSSGSTNYRVFSLQGKLYNDELQLPAFEGFENEIVMWIIFNAYSNK